ncbi:MAG: CDP-alcohol phosphatidyltransferase family protein [Dysgonamonadaceae bacterium]|jgi:CDP-diacylglycerol--serine O-phosphatidyltransferase|nr:CDP-alcohol phosphatidyltransferase family protein [Dysgonamonadaceae bacterium]
MKHLANILTCFNLFSGCLAVVFALEYDGYSCAFFFIFLAAVFDFFDGFAARLFRAESAIGAQLDSLADVVSFGVAPGVLVFAFLNDCVGGVFFLPWVAFFLPVFAALRLARFNVNVGRVGYFVGLPVPACALFFASLASFCSGLRFEGFFVGVFAVFVTFLVGIFCWLMISDIPMFTLKFKSWAWDTNRLPYIQAIATVVLTAGFYVAGFGFSGVGLSILFYILLSLFARR